MKLLKIFPSYDRCWHCLHYFHCIIWTFWLTLCRWMRFCACNSLCKTHTQTRQSKKRFKTVFSFFKKKTFYDSWWRIFISWLSSDWKCFSIFPDYKTLCLTSDQVHWLQGPNACTHLSNWVPNVSRSGDSISIWYNIRVMKDSKLHHKWYKTLYC